jgi:predicted ATPase
MASIIAGYNYDIFISYRQKDNKGDKWVSEFVDALKDELESTFKEEISVYFDINPYNGLLETHDVDESLKEKLKCLVFLPIISRTYCDPKSFAWEHELKAFIDYTSNDKYGLKIQLHGGNIAARVLPVRIHDLDEEDLKLCESVMGGFLRGIEFIYKSAGVNRPLTPTDNPDKNLNNTFYRDQINKVALAIKDLIKGMKSPASDKPGQETAVKAEPEITEKKEAWKAATGIKHNLPAQLTTFIGREKEMQSVKDLISAHRLVTLTGAGGCGKTRLAIQFASQVVSDYADGVWMVELAPVTVPDHIDQAIAEVFRIKEQPGSTLLQIITHYLENKNLLLILDNCEHLISACSEIVEQILKSTEHVTILSTSREALNVADEVAWGVPSLSLPENGKELSATEVNQYEAVQLFVARAKNKQARFNLSEQNARPVLQICNRLDGIPLAIELAASRINVLNPEHIASKLDNRFRLLTGGSRTALERHKTLQATIDWSYDLLSDHEKEIFHLLSVFVGGFDLEAYENIYGAVTGDRDEMTDLLTGLIEKSLVITRTTKEGGYRYQLLETIRHYSKEKLLESGQSEAARASHFQYYYGLAEKAYLENIERYAYWIVRLEVEHENMIAALEWSRDDPERRLQLAGVLGWFWSDHSHFRLGLDYLKDLEDIHDDKILTSIRAMTYSGLLSLVAGHPESLAISEKGIELCNGLNNKREKAKALFYFSIIKSIFQDYKTAEEVAAEIKEIAVELKDDFLLLRARTAQIYIHIYQLQVDSAEPLAEQNLKDANALNDFQMRTWNLHCYSDCALMRKDYKETEKRYSIALKTNLEIGNLFQSLNELTGMIYGLSGQGRYRKALRLQGAVDAKLNEYGIPMFQIKFWMDWFEEYVNGARKTVGVKKATQYEEEGRQTGFEKAVEYALDFDKD